MKDSGSNVHTNLNKRVSKLCKTFQDVNGHRRSSQNDIVKLYTKWGWHGYSTLWVRGFETAGPGRTWNFKHEVSIRIVCGKRTHLRGMIWVWLRIKVRVPFFAEFVIGIQRWYDSAQGNGERWPPFHIGSFFVRVIWVWFFIWQRTQSVHVSSWCETWRHPSQFQRRFRCLGSRIWRSHDSRCAEIDHVGSGWFSNRRHWDNSMGAKMAFCIGSDRKSSIASRVATWKCYSSMGNHLGQQYNKTHVLHYCGYSYVSANHLVYWMELSHL